MGRITITAVEGVDSKYIDSDWKRKFAYPWRVTIEYDDKTMEIPFFMGVGIGKEPTDEDVIPCLISDYFLVVDNDFQEWANELGYDLNIDDLEQLHDSYRQCLEQSEDFAELLGNDFDEIVEYYEDK